MSFKKIVSYIMLFVFFTINIFPVCSRDIAVKEEESLGSLSKEKKSINDIDAASRILTCYNTGQVLFEQNADEKRPIASVAKIMTILLVVEAVENEKISLDDIVTITENAKPSNNESSLWLSVGEKISVRDLLKGVVVNSANDAARALAEYVGGSEEGFVEMMNKRAKELEMKNTHFANSTGIDDEDGYSSARDISIMAKELLKCKWITNFTKITGNEKKQKIGSNGTQLCATNMLLTTYEGCNGLKTGTEEKAGHCLCATAIRDNIPLCAISLGSKKRASKWKNCTALLDYGYNNFQPIKINKDIIEEKQIPVIKGKQAFFGCECEDGDYNCLIKKTEAKDIRENVVFDKDIEAPVKKGQHIGNLEYLDNKNNVVASIKIISSESVDRIDFMSIFGSMFRAFFTGKGFYN